MTTNQGANTEGFEKTKSWEWQMSTPKQETMPKFMQPGWSLWIHRPVFVCLCGHMLCKRKKVFFGRVHGRLWENGNSNFGIYKRRSF